MEQLVRSAAGHASDAAVVEGPSFVMSGARADRPEPDLLEIETWSFVVARNSRLLTIVLDVVSGRHTVAAADLRTLTIEVGGWATFRRTRGQFDHAVTAFTLTAALALSLGDDALRASAELELARLGRIRDPRRRFEEAESHLTTARNLYLSAGPPDDVARCDVEWAHLLLAVREFDRAREQYRGVLRGLESRGQRAELAECHRGMAQAHLMTGGLDDALDEVAKARVADTGEENQQHCLILEVQATREPTQNQIDALRRARSFFQFRKDGESRLVRVDCDTVLGRILIPRDPVEALIRLQRAQAEFGRLFRRGRQARCLLAIGIACLELARNDPAAREQHLSRAEKATLSARHLFSAGLETPDVLACAEADHNLAAIIEYRATTATSPEQSTKYRREALVWLIPAFLYFYRLRSGLKSSADRTEWADLRLRSLHLSLHIAWMLGDHELICDLVDTRTVTGRQTLPTESKLLGADLTQDGSGISPAAGILGDIGLGLGPPPLLLRPVAGRYSGDPWDRVVLGTYRRRESLDGALPIW